ncbi:type II toxin-antitoxin system Phd/YefM family antitoxin [Jiella avicenniae]|uniref:Antitoxin n=1 Tax=Jiella avicenniae TaxID=2907202 RepID=A0A9X1T6Y1_9HYPH|nr:type II toxin-antitoxin system Phd/YefM family antitoxin [Jiella avicenniae]MCE7030264.1 type II toxin-antitoxin system Phd/YefM family antitoxin [Jiella avicenniae]
MRVSIAEAEERLTELADRAAAGEEVILTRDDKAVARLLPVENTNENTKKRTIDRDVIRALQAEVRAKASPGPCAARSQDFLYDEYGLPA